ncbi:hypothetical protein BJ165DRAFT_172290 [Panaeolus papilionaceus]|nr:hypothetical protein BJ165DRAFT_172290 [Panaeolus papilionaceus]
MNVWTPVFSSSTHAEAMLCPDILPLILDLFDPTRNEDKNTLQSLALTSHFFAARCQAILFKEIFLCDIRGTPHKPLSKAFIPIGKRCKLLMQLLKSRPHLIELVQRVKVGMSGCEKALGKIKEFQALLTMLLSRPGIRCFQTFHLRGDCFLANNNSFQNHLLYPFLATRVTSLCFDSVRDLPIAAVAHCENLQSLSVKNTKMQQGSDLIHVLPNGGPKIKVLHHETSLELLKYLIVEPSKQQPFIDVGGLKQYTTSFRTPSADIPLFATICAFATQSLQTVALTVDLFNEGLSNTQGFDLLDFSHCRRVESLKMELNISLMGPTDCQSRLHDVAVALQTFPKSSDLRRLTLLLHIHSAQYHPHYLRSCKTAWTTLDTELARISDHQPVSIEVSIKYSTDAYHPGNEEMANELEGIFRNINTEFLALTRARKRGSFRLLFEFVNECYSDASYCRRWLHY